MARSGLFFMGVVVFAAACGSNVAVFGDPGAGGDDGSAGGTSTSTTTTSTGSGGAFDCVGADECPVPALLCVQAVCINGSCEVAPVTPGTSCGPDSVCDVDGNCVLEQGAACGGDSECESGHCVDGVCCDAACDGDCRACDLSGLEGICSPHLAGTDPDDECNPGVCDGIGACAAGTHLWSKAFGGTDDQYLFNSAIDAANNILVVGYFGDNINLGLGVMTSAGGRDVVLGKFSPGGTLLWQKRFGDGASQYSWAIAADANNNVYLLGYFFGSIDFGDGGHTSAGDSDLVLVKLSPSGGLLWSKSFGDGSLDRGRGLAVDGQGNVIISGWYYGSINFGGATHNSVHSRDAFVAKFDTDGNFLHSLSWGGTNWQTAYAVAVDSTNNVYVTGYFEETTNFGGNNVTSNGNLDAFLVKLDPTFNHQWELTMGNNAEQRGRSVVVDGSGNVVIGGYFQGTVDAGGGVINSNGNFDVFVAKLDSAGNHLWSTGLGNSNNQLVQSVAVDGTGNVVLTGSNFGDIDFGGGTLTGSSSSVDAFFVKLSDNGGQHVWSYLFGAAGGQYGYSVAVDSANDIVLCGYFSGSVNFGGATFNSANPDDAFLAKFAP